MKNEILHLDEILAYHDIKDEYKHEVACMEISAATPKLGTIQPMYANAYSILLVESGSAKYSINFHEYELNEGDLLILFPQLLTAITSFSDDFRAKHLMVEDLVFEHNVENDTVSHRGDAALGVVNNGYSTPRAASPQLDSIDYIPILHLDENQQAFFSHLLGLITLTIRYNGNNKGQMLLQLIHVCQLRLMDFRGDKALSLHSFSHTEKIFRDFIRLVADNYITEHKTEFYASKLCVSKSYLSRIVREESNQSIKKIILDQLNHEACRRLRQTDEPITSIASSLCFNDNSAFTRFFIKMNGVAPAEYRNS